MLLDAFWHFDGVARLHGFIVGDLVAEVDESFDIGARDDFALCRSRQQSLLRFLVAELGLFSFFPANAFGMRIDSRIEIVDQTFLTNVMDDLEMRGIRAEAFAQVFL